MKPLEELRALYDSEFAPIFAEIRAAREAATKKAWILFLCLAPVLCVALWFFMREAMASLLCALLAASVIALAYGFGKNTRQNHRFKDTILQKTLAFVAPGMRYDRKKFIPLSEFKKSGIYTESISRYDGEDCFLGKYEEVDLAFSEVHAQKLVSNGKSSHHVTIFKGVFFIADFNKDFHTSTFVLPNRAEEVLGTSFGRWAKKMDISHKGKLIRLENPEFEKMFAVYAQDAIEARYILTPNIMERMMAIQRRFPGDVAFAFHASAIYITIPSKTDFFELPPTLDFSGIAALHHELALFLGLVHEMNLTLRIWTKQGANK